MTPTADPVLVRRLSIFASAAALFSGLIGFSVLAGWTLRIYGLTTWGIAPVKMVANTAACFVLIGASLWLQRKGDGQPGMPARRLAAKAAAAVAGLVGLISLGEHLLGRNFGIDQLLVQVSAADHTAGVRPGLMSSLTAADFLILAVALLLLDWKTRRDDWPAQFLCLGASVVTAFGFSALILSSDTFPTSMSWPTTVTFFVMEFGLICSRADWALGGLLVGQSVGARLLRRAVPGAFLVLGLIGWLISKPLLTDAHLTWVQVSALAVFCGVLLAGFIAWVAFQLERGETQREKVEAALNVEKEQLDRLLNRSEIPESEKLLRRRVTAGFGVAIFLTALLGFLSWRNSRLAAEDADWVAHTNEVLTALEATLRHLVDVETGARGFAMTGDEPFLEPYETGEAAVEQDLQTLHRLTGDNVGQQRRLDLLEQQVNARIQAARSLVALRESTREVPTEAQLKPGKRLMDGARDTVERMEAEEKLLRERRRQRVRGARQSTDSIIAIGSLLGAVFLLIAGAAVNREIGISARARAQVSALNADLERRVAQRTAALGESEGRLAGVIQSAMDAILTVDEGQSILMFNGAAEKMFRCTAAEALGQPITRFIPQRFHSAHAGHIQKFGETGVTSRAMGSKNALWAARADGQEFQIEASISQVVTGGKKLFTVILRDVTERVLAEQSLREAQARMTGIIASAMDPIITTDDQQRILVFNAAAEKVFRCPAPEALGRSITRFIPQRFHAAHGGHMKEFAEKGITTRAMGTLGALWGVRADGEEFRIEASISHISAGGRNLFTVILRDITERVQAEARREHLAAVVNSSDDAIISKDLRGIINAWNRGAEKIFGYTAAEAVGKPMLMLFPPERVGEEADILARIARGESVEHFETVRVRKDGTRIDVSVTISPIRDATGAVIGASKIARDITEHKRAQEALRQSDLRRGFALDTAQIGDWDLDPVTLQASRSALHDQIFGYSAPLPEWNFDIFLRHIHADDRERVRETFQSSVAAHKKWEFECRIVWPNGDIRWIWACGDQNRDASGKAIRMYGIVRDVTERKQTEEALREQAQVMDSAQVFVRDMQSRVVYWPKGAEKLYGFTREEAVGILSHDLFHTKFPEPLEMVERKLSETGTWEGELIHTRRDGSTIVVSSAWALHRDKEGQPIRILETNIDITPRKRAEDALRESETNFAAIVNLAPQFVWICTNEGLNTYFNDRWFQYTGLTAEQSHGTGWNTPFHPDDKQTAWDHWNQATATGKTYMVESRLRAANGSYRWFLVRGEPVRDANGGIVKWFGTCTDIDEMKRAQAELRESEERFQAMANGIPQLACMAGADGHIFWYNQRWYDYTGTTPEQMEGWGWQSVLDAAVLPSVLERWASAIASAEPFEMEFQLRRADGVFGTFLNRVMPLKDAAGDVTRWFGTNTDISERKQMELRLKAQAQELSASSQSLEAQTRVFKLVLDSMGEGLIAADGEGRFIIWNEAARQQMGRDAADLPGEQWRDFYKVFLPDGVTPYPPESLPLLRALRGESVRVELMVEQPDHAEGVFLEVTARPMKDAEGDLCGGVAVLRDITERKHSDARLARLAEELSGRASELAASRQALETESLMLQSVLNSMSEGLVAADETGKFILWNPAAARIVGLGGTNVPPGEWGSYYGTYLPDTITPFPMDQNPLVRAIRGEVCSAEIFIRNPELEHGVWIESNGAPLRAKNGVLRGGVVAFRDITQRRADELEIRKLNEELEERVLLRTAELATANQELEAFAYSVSHDLRAPLRHIGGFSKILIEDFGPTLAPEAVRHLERIEEGTRRMGMLVDELLNLAQVGRHALKLQSTPLNSLIEEVISLLQPEVQGRVVTWKVAELPAAECDPVLTKQIFQNLIANALKFTRPRERAVIEIGIVPEGGQMAVFVRDNGVGFDMKYSDKLFGVFQRLHRIEDFEGTGVGLATVQRIVHKHGGRVWAEAELDKGAAFFFTLEPVKGSHLKAEEVLRSEAKALNTKETGSKAAAAAGDGK